MRAFSLHTHRSSPIRRVRTTAFTLVEILISVSVLALLVALTGQILSRTNAAVQVASKQLDIASQARTVLDQIGSNIANMMVAQGIAPIVVKDTGDTTSGSLNDGLAVITNGRPRSRSSVSNGPPSFVRMAAMGFRVISLQDNLLNNASVPMLNWGDGTISWSTAGGAIQNATDAKSDMTTAISVASTDLSTGSQKMLNFQI